MTVAPLPETVAVDVQRPLERREALNPSDSLSTLSLLE